MENILVQCYVSTPGFEDGTTYYADAVDTGDGVVYRVSADGQGDGAEFSEANFRRYFKPLQHRASSGRKSYGGFKMEDSDEPSGGADEGGDDEAEGGEEPAPEVSESVKRLLGYPVI